MIDWLQEKIQAHKNLPKLCPKLNQVPFTVADVTSKGTFKYNCAAYAFKDETKPWWPIDPKKAGRYYYWPDGLPRNNSVADFILAFEREGFEKCDTGDHEEGYEKVAIYVDASDTPKHLARDEGDGRWKSKLGDLQDIRHHTLDAVETADYGTAKYFMRKPLKTKGETANEEGGTAEAERGSEKGQPAV
ncbi:MAG: hypothetical protein M3348_15375 [Acidobacteriota bacterium]|nr:hypothetical protein [Acidobacteriota bacterium]